MYDRHLLNSNSSFIRFIVLNLQMSKLRVTVIKIYGNPPEVPHRDRSPALPGAGAQTLTRLPYCSREVSELGGLGWTYWEGPSRRHNHSCLLPPGLMVSGFAVTGAVLGQERLINYAISGAKFLKRHMFDVASGRLMRTCYAGSGGTVEHRWGAGQSRKACLLGHPMRFSLPLFSSLGGH